MQELKFAICNEFIEKAKNECASISPMKLQKLLFFTFGYFAAKTDRYLFLDEKFEVWQFGPVLPSVYQYFKDYRTKDIRDFAIDFRGFIPRISKSSSANVVLLEVIKSVWEKYGSFDAIRLSALTHEKGTPWDKALRSKKYYIENSDILEYFKGKING